MRDPVRRNAWKRAQRAKLRRQEDPNSYYRNRERPATVDCDGEMVSADDRDGTEFRDYVKVVEAALKAARGEPLSVREIKAALGDRLVERWLFDALAVSTHVLHIRGYIDRFAYFEKLAVRVVHGRSWQDL